MEKITKADPIYWTHQSLKDKTPIHFTFPADCKNQDLAGVTAEFGEVVVRKGVLAVEFRTLLNDKRIVGRADSYPELYKMACDQVLESFGVSTTHSIDTKAGYYTADKKPVDTGRVIDGTMGEIPCSIHVAYLAESGITRVFALVDHPDFGLIGVSEKELLALSLPEIKEHPVNLVGRPAVLEEGKRVNVYLDAQSIETAKKLGGGNVSEGIRKSLKKLSE